MKCYRVRCDLAVLAETPRAALERAAFIVEYSDEQPPPWVPHVVYAPVVTVEECDASKEAPHA